SSQIQLKHALAKPPLQRGLLVSAKIKTALLGQFLQQVFKGDIPRHFRIRLPSQRSINKSARPEIETTKSTQSVAIADCGMTRNSADEGSCATVVPPASLIARMPTAPSRFDPLKTTPIDRDPYIPATDSNNKSIDGREKCTSCECASWIFPGPTR